MTAAALEEKLHQLVQTELILGVRTPPNQFEPNVGFAGFVQVDEMRVPLLPNAHQALVFDDTAQPGAEGSFAPVLLQTKECLPKGVLNLIFSVTAIADHQASALET